MHYAKAECGVSWHGLTKQKAAKVFSEKTGIPLTLSVNEWIVSLMRSESINPLQVVKLPNGKSHNKKKKKEQLSFYKSEAWLALRRKVISAYGRRCMKCNVMPRVVHVDHIKPRSRHRELELDFNNLQVLCKKCNIEKSNIHETDYRK